MRVLWPDGMKAAVDPILEILKKYKTVAVVGLSSNPARPSYGVTEYMQSAGYRIIPVNPNETEVLGEKSYARLGGCAGEDRDCGCISAGGKRAGCRGECDTRWGQGGLDAIGN